MSEREPESTLLRKGAEVGRPRGDGMLRVIAGPDAGLWVPVPEDKFLVGSAAVCQLRLSDPMVSRLHAELRWQDGGLLVRDLGSSNGTFYLGSRITEAVIPIGGVLVLGDSKVVLLPELDALDLPVHPEPALGRLVGRSEAMRRLFTAIEKLAPTDATVLLIGETGTGKDAIAREIHGRSRRAAGPFVVVDCASVAPSLIESELFGHERGAFTGAHARHAGAFERAAGGTVFLDEVGELPPPLQPKLLRVLEDRTVQRVGGTERVAIDLRVIAATHRDLEALVEAGTFRADLFYRLAVAILRVPALRERPEDLPLLVERLVAESASADALRPTDDTLALLERHDWPGNVRELRNFVERALAFGDERLLRVGPLVSRKLRQLPADVRFRGVPFKDAKKQVVEEFERQYLRALLQECDFNLSQAARKAGIDRNHLADLAERYGLKPG